MIPAGRDELTLRRAPGLEVIPLGGGRGAEVSASRTRRVVLTPDALWLLERLDGRRSVRELTTDLGARFGRDISPADAADVLDRTLVAHGLAMYGPAGASLSSPAVRHALRVALLRAPTVRAFASFLAPLAWPPLALALLAGAIAALSIAAQRVAVAGGSAWTSPGAWLLAPGLVVATLLAHEMGHALALARAGGEPGAISAIFTGWRVRLATELSGLDGLTPIGRAGVDVAGFAAQWCVLGTVSAVALATRQGPPAPALAAGVALALAEMLPLAGSDGRWLLDDLARHDPADTIRRPVSPGRWLSRLAVRIGARIEASRRRGRFGDLVHLLPVFVSASFPLWSPGKLRAFAYRHIASASVAKIDHRDLGSTRFADEVRHVRPIRTLRSEGRGAIVCAMHVGPFQYASASLIELGCPVTAYAADNQRQEFARGWIEGAARVGGQVELLSPGSVRDAIRAVRAVRGGRMLFVLMDGQVATDRDQHRADFRFLGNDLYMRTGPAWLSQRAGAPIVLASTCYEGVARRVVEFSDPLPPPTDATEAAVVARTSEMYAWFEKRVARDPAQWDGWVLPLQHWRSAGGSPTASAAELEAMLRRVRRALAGDPASARITAEPTHVNVARWQGEDLIVDGPRRRVLVASPLACAALDAAFHRERLSRLAARTGTGAEALAPEIARLVLAELVTLEG